MGITELFRKFVKMAREFGLSVALSSFISNVLYKINKQNNKCLLAVFANKWKHFNIEKYLYKKLKFIVKNYSDRERFSEFNNEYEKIIWTMWWQENEMPEEIKICLRSIKKFSADYKLVVITRNNVNKYVSLPDCVKNKINLGMITYTHLSDIIRVYLIKNYGGLWLDSTIFVSREIPKKIFDYAYYTNKLNPEETSCISKKRWAGYILAGKPNNIYCCFMLDCFYKYWETEETLIDYFLIDYLTDIAYNNLTEFKILYDELEQGSEMIDQLEIICNNPYEPQILLSLFESNTFFKLQRRNIHKKYDANKNITFYGKLADIFLD